MKLAVFVDFDDTVTTKNAAHFVLNKFAPDAMKRFRTMYLQGDMSFCEYQENAFNSIKAPLSEIQKAVAGEIELRPGFTELVETVQASGGTVTVASSGLDIYVKPVLRRYGLGDLPVACGSAVRGEADTGPFRYDYSFAGEPCGDDWASCKCRALKLAPTDAITVFAGDSVASDSCAAEAADYVFARDRLLGYCEENGIPATPFEDFHPLVEFVRELAARQPVEPEI